MKHYIVDNHSSFCTEDIKEFDFFGTKIKKATRDNCKKVHTVFFINYEFHILTLNKCIKDHELVIYLFNQIYDNKIKIEEAKPCYNYHLRMSDEIKEIRKNEYRFSNFVPEVNYVYGFNKRYCLITKQPYIEKLFSNIKDEFAKTIEYVSENKLYGIDEDIRFLYECNIIIDDVNDRTIHATINEITEKLKNNQLKNKTK